MYHILNKNNYVLFRIGKNHKPNMTISNVIVELEEVMMMVAVLAIVAVMVIVVEIAFWVELMVSEVLAV